MAMAVIAPAFPAAAGPERAYGSWRSSRIGGGGYVLGTHLSASDPLHMYANTDVGGAYRSDDGGHTWRMLLGAFPRREGYAEVRALSVDPRNGNDVLAAVGGAWAAGIGIFRTMDGGETWTLAQETQFAGNGDRRWDGTALARNPRNPDEVLAAAVKDGVWRSADGGRSWTPGGPGGLYPSDIAWGRDGRTAWLCAHPQRTWKPLAPGQNGEAELKGGFFRSTDGGHTWTRLSAEAPDELVEDPQAPGTLYGIFGWMEIRRSSDRGGTWVSWSRGLATGGAKTDDFASDRRYQALAAGPDFVLCASAAGSVYRLDAGARGWVRQERKGVEKGSWWGIVAGDGWKHFGAALASISVDPRNPRRWAMTDWFAIWLTDDGGANWRLSIDGVEETVIHHLAQDPFDPDTIHLGMADNGYFRSRDGGTSFEKVGFPGGGANVRMVSPSPARRGRIYAVGSATHGWESSQVYVSDDGGTSWRRAAMRGIPEKDRACNSIAAGPGDPDEAWLAVAGEVRPGGGGAWVTHDGGEDWTWAGEGLPGGREAFRRGIWDAGGPELAASPSGDLVAASRSGKAVFRRSRGEGRWERVRLPGDEVSAPWGVAMDSGVPARFYVSDWWRLWRTDDGGLSWTMVRDRDTGPVATDAARPGRVIVGGPDGVAVSGDAGASWLELDRSLPRRDYDRVAFTRNRAVAGTSGNGVFWARLDVPAVPSGGAPDAGIEPGGRHGVGGNMK